MPARTLPTLHLPSPPTVHQLSRLALQELIVNAWKSFYILFYTFQGLMVPGYTCYSMYFGGETCGFGG